MKNRKSEIATILMIGAVVVMGVTAVISSFTQQDKRTTQSRAGQACESPERRCGSTECFNPSTQRCDGGRPVALSSVPPTATPTRRPLSNPRDTRTEDLGVTPTKTPIPTKTPTPTAPCTRTYCTSGLGEEYWIKSNKKYENDNCTKLMTVSLINYCRGESSPTNPPANTTAAPTATPTKAASSTVVSGVGNNGKYSSSDEGFCPLCCNVSGSVYRDRAVFRCCDKNGGQAGCYESPCGANRLTICSEVPVRNAEAQAEEEAKAEAQATGLYPQNTTPDFNMACCFRQGDRVRVYAHAAARSPEGAQMDTPCTKDSYGDAYNADDWFECPDNTPDDTTVDVYKDLVEETPEVPSTDDTKCIPIGKNENCKTKYGQNWSNILNTGSWYCCPPGVKPSPSSGDPVATFTPIPSVVPGESGDENAVPQPTADVKTLPNKTGYTKSTCKIECGPDKTPLVDKAIYVKPGGFYIIDGISVSSLSMCNCIKPTPVPAQGTINKSGIFFNYYSCSKVYDCTTDTSPICKLNLDSNPNNNSWPIVDCFKSCGSGTDCLTGNTGSNPYKPYLYCCAGTY
jgi:hypothetical protein